MCISSLVPKLSESLILLPLAYAPDLKTSIWGREYCYLVEVLLFSGSMVMVFRKCMYSFKVMV